MLISNFEDYTKENLPSPIQCAIEEFLALYKAEKTLFQIVHDFNLSEKTNNAKVIVQRYTTKDYEESKYESHSIMTDIQIVLEGEEYIYTRQIDDLTIASSGEDIVFYNEKPEDKVQLHLKDGLFALFYPEDAHAPGVKVEENSPVLKVVIKVPLGNIDR